MSAYNWRHSQILPYYILIHPINKLGVSLSSPKYHGIKIIVLFAIPSQVDRLGYQVSDVSELTEV